MKKLLGIICLICSIQPVFADHTAKLQIKVAGTSQNNTYFLCVNHNGCMSMHAAAHGRSFPVDPGKVTRIYMVNAKNLQMIRQAIPSSCNIDIKENQTITVSGKIAQRANGQAPN